MWTGPPAEGEDSSLSTSNHSAAGPQARSGLQQFDSVFKTAQKKEDTHRTRTICFIFLQQQKKQKGHSPYLNNLLHFFTTAKNKEDIHRTFHEKLKYGLQNFKK
jgi:hypothetical protein